MHYATKVCHFTFSFSFRNFQDDECTSDDEGEGEEQQLEGAYEDEGEEGEEEGEEECVDGYYEDEGIGEYYEEEGESVEEAGEYVEEDEGEEEVEENEEEDETFEGDGAEEEEDKYAQRELEVERVSAIKCKDCTLVLIIKSLFPICGHVSCRCVQTRRSGW